MSGRSTGSVRSIRSGLAQSTGSLNKGASSVSSAGTPNGHVSPLAVRTRHFSTGSSNHSDDPEQSIISDITTASNFFDFDENADDLYLAAPEEHVHKLRKEEKKRGR